MIITVALGILYVIIAIAFLCIALLAPMPWCLLGILVVPFVFWAAGSLANRTALK